MPAKTFDELAGSRLTYGKAIIKKRYCMLKIFYTILEVAYVALPLFVAAIFLLRRSETYNDNYQTSKFKAWGVSLGGYKIFYRVIGLICLCLAGLAVYKNYIEEPDDELSDARKFWEDVNKRKDLPLQGAMLLGAAIAIPARMGSTRFPGKPLALLGGKAVLERVYESCVKSELAEKVVILTDSIEIMEFSDKIGAPAIMTSEKCRSGTERIIEAFGEINADFVVNVQGDEPFISSKLIDAVIEAHSSRGSDLVTAASKITYAEMLSNPNVVKVLRDNSGAGMYFSRSPLPYNRGEPDVAKWLDRCDYWRHIGIYGYSEKSLVRYDSLPVSKLEQCEMLEQLRFIAAGWKFDIVETQYESIGIDTPDDLEAAEEFLRKRNS